MLAHSVPGRVEAIGRSGGQRIDIRDVEDLARAHGERRQVRSFQREGRTLPPRPQRVLDQPAREPLVLEHRDAEILTSRTKSVAASAFTKRRTSRTMRSRTPAISGSAM